MSNMTTTDGPLDIGDVIHQSGLPPSTLHVWEKHGLITPTGRDGLRRQYAPDILERIAAIVLLQRGGFSLAEISDLLRPDTVAAGKEQFARKLDELRQRQHELATAISGLEHALACSEPSPIECPDFRSMLSNVLPVERN